MAEVSIQEGFRNFDDGFASLERDLPTLTDLEITPRINKLIAILNPIGPKFEMIASSGRQDDVTTANKYVDELNGRMKKCDNLSKSIDWNKAKANRKPVETVVQLSAPIKPTPVYTPHVVSEEDSVVMRPLEILSQNCKNAIAEFNRIYSQYQNITKMDVWAGKSNNVVEAWTKWCQVHSSYVADAVKNSTGNPPPELRDIVSKYNTFGADLSQKINSFNLTQQQSNFILQFPKEHDEIYNGFRKEATSSNPNVPQLEGYYRRLQNMLDELNNLGLYGHPSVVNALVITHDSLKNMYNVINQLKINPKTKITFSDSPNQSSVNSSHSNVQPSSSAIKFCTDCGAPSQGGKFCGECGRPY